MIRGRYVLGRPQISGLLQFATIPKFAKSLVSVRFLMDTGADATLVQPVDYEPSGLRYRVFDGFPLAKSTRGFGGKIGARSVPAALYLRHEDGHYDRISLTVDVARPTEKSEGLPSVLGRDVLDLYELIMDRSRGVITLEPAQGPTDPWPDEKRPHETP